MRSARAADRIPLGTAASPSTPSTMRTGSTDQTVQMPGEEPTTPDSDDDAERRTGRGFDALLGAAARAVRATGSVVSGGERVANALLDSPLGRVTAGAARRVTEPLAREGAEVREQLEEDVPAVARGVSSRLVPTVVDSINPDVVLGAIDLDELMARIDVNAVVQRIDQVDLNALMERIDVNALIQRVDVNALMERVDVDHLVQRTELGGLIAKSTSGMASGAVDVVRRQGVGLDNFVARWFDRLTRRDRSSSPPGPILLVTVPRAAIGTGDTA